MPFTVLTGYVLEPPRVGGSNSPFTFTPSNFISNQSAFDAAYPTDESSPRTEYMIQVLREDATGTATGPGSTLVLPDALFAWTKNEGAIQGGLTVPFQRFDYSGQDQVFKPLQGAPRELVGTLAADSNTVRLAVAVPPLLTNLAAFPIRVSVGSSGSGTTFPVTVVSTFGSPSSGTVEMNAAGELNWNASNLVSFLGSPVYFQRQTFYFPNETDGVLGTLGTDPLLLNPLPTTGQIPAIKIGSRNYLTAVQRATEAAFASNPTVGTVEWALNTGRLKFNTTDVSTLSGQPVVYDGVFMATFQVPVASLGLAQSTPCGTLHAVPSESSDTYFRISGVVQFPETVFVDALNATGKKGQVQIRRSDGAVQLSAADRAEYSGLTVQAIVPDVLIERGVSLRLFRSPVDPAATTEGVKDVTGFYTQESAILASPIIGQPFVFLPALPREDATSTVLVSQGTGSFVGELERLDVATPPTGKGYVLDFQTRQLSYAERKEDEILPTSPFAFSSVQLPNAPVFATGLVIELEEDAGLGNFITQVRDDDYIIDLGSGTITFTQTDGGLILAGTATSLSSSTLTVPESLTGAAVQDGDLLVILSGLSEGVYTISDVLTSSTATVTPSFPSAASNVPYEIRRGKEILADRFFLDVPPVDPNTSVERINPLGTISNSPRLSINPALAPRVRFRFGKTVFSTTTSLVTSFTAPGSLAAGVVEVNSTTGQLNFSQADVTAGGTVYWSLALILGTEYTLQPTLGFIEFVARMLENEETHLRYTVIDDDGVTKVSVEERGSFLVPKELVQAHPVATSTLSFNPEGREVASTPAPAAFRGGRPQSSAQVTFDVEAGTVTFLDDDVATDALPHGASIDPTENVYVDYYIHEAIGGERNLSVTRPPMATVQVVISSEDESGNPQTSFTIDGDRTLDFQSNRLLEVDRSELYLLSGSTYDGTETTITLDQTVPQVFRSDLTNPPLRVTSGAVRRLAAGVLPSYFGVEAAAYDTIARGSKEVRLQGDLSRAYSAGSVLVLTDSLTFQEYLLVEGASYDAETNRTRLVLASGVMRQHTSPTTLLKSVRPILPSAAGVVSTSNSPVLSLPFTVYRQVEGEVGQLLTRDVDYTIDDSGKVTFIDGLALEEEMGIFYTGVSVVEAGCRTRVSWTFAIVPTVDNGLANQVLTMDYTTYIPDTFFYRVESLTNYRGELVEQFSEEAKAQSPSQGPVLENAGGTPLFEKGSPSLFFEEGDLANQDLVARGTLVGFNNIINDLEAYIQALSGQVIGDHDGPFLFDGNLDNPVRTAFSQATNQIDDLIQVFGSTPKRAFEAANYSRFYPTQKLKYGAAANPAGLVTGDPILNLDETALKAVASVRNRSPWAVTTQAAAAGSTVFQVDHAQGHADLLRPGLNVEPSLKVAITKRDGTVLVADGAPATVASTTATSVTLTGPVGVPVPKGSTIRMASTDDVYRQTYTLGIDVGVDVSGGLLTHLSTDDVPAAFEPNSSPAAGVPLDVVVQCGATSTEPARFPALDGGTTDDDGNRQFPALGIDGELSGVTDELALINAATGTLDAAVAPSFVSSGTVASSTTITITPVAPLPEIGDLFRLLTGGTEGTSYYHRITAVAGSTITVQPALNISSGAVTFEITTTGAVLTSGGGGTLMSTTTLEDTGGDFVANGVRPGQTVVGVSGTFVGQRRQIATVDSLTQLSVSSPFTGIGPITYQIVNNLATFGGVAGSLQASWATALEEELRALEGQDLIDFSERIVEEVTTQTLTVSAISMGAFSSLLVFAAIDNNGSGVIDVTSATFNATPLTPLSLTGNSGSGGFGLHVYLGSNLAGVTGNLVITATDTAPNTKVFALKLSKVKNVTVGVATVSTAPATLGASGMVSREAGDLVVSLACSAEPNNELYPIVGHDTLIPQFSGSGVAAVLTATRATAAKQSVTPQFRVVGSAAQTRVATVVLSKDSGADPIVDRPLSEKAALERFFDDAAPDRGLGTLVGAITGATTITGFFTNVAAGDVIFVRHGPNAGVYTVATATTSSATVVEAFPASPETSVSFKAGRPVLVTIEALQEAFTALENVEEALVGTGALLLLHHCPILVYRNGTPSGGLPGTPDSSFTESGGRLVLGGAYARGISSLTAREAALLTRAATTDQTNLEGTLSSDRLYDGRFVWIDSRINMESGILPKKDRAVENRQKAVEKIVKNLTKLLTT